MEIAPGVHRLENLNGSNVVLIADEQMAVVDTGIAGNGDAIVDQIRKIGRSPSDLRWIVVTHFHFDHSGSAAELHELTGARIVAHSAETLAGAGRHAATPQGQRRRVAAKLVPLGAAFCRRRRRAAKASGPGDLP